MRCDDCDRRWDASARFCGRCGAWLRPRGTPPDRDRAERRRGRAVLRPAPLIAVAALLLASAAVAVVRGPGIDAADRGIPDATVSIPTAERPRVTNVVRAADRAQRPLDCGDDLQDLPRPVRHYGLYVGTLEWHDGRLCSRVDQRRSEPAVPRCDPPWVLACPIP